MSPDPEDEDPTAAPPRREPDLFPVRAGPLPAALQALGRRLADELVVAGAPRWAPAPGQRLGAHELLAPLGQGGQGEVWRARALADGAPRAVKVLAPGAAIDPRQALRFGREARLLSRVAHPGLVRVHEVGLAPDGRPFFAMDLVPEARTLGEALRAGLGREPALDAVEQALEALVPVHAAGLVHRDLKPGNLLLGGDGRVRVVDFGLARGPREARLTSTGEVWGTPGWLAPEQLAGDTARIGPWSDVFALGALLHLVLAGVPLVAEPGAAPRARLGPEVPPALAEVCRRALAPDPAARPRDAGQLLAELRRARGERRVPPGLRLAVLLSAALAGGAWLALALASGRGAPPAGPAPSGHPDAPSSPPLPSAPAAVASSRDPTLPPRPLPAGLLPGPAAGLAKNGRDGSILVWIPPGTLRMGSELGSADERPVHEVALEGFFLGRTELDWGRWERFCAASGRPSPAREIAGEPLFVAGDDHPVFGVTLAEARAYCDWAGLRLPSEAEWERAARGGDDRRFPWGPALPRDGTRVANVADRTARLLAPPNFGVCDEGYDDGAFYPTPVGTYPAGASPFGCLDLAGNVWEWTDDAYRPYDDPLAPPGDPQVVRGGSWDNPPDFSRSTNRGQAAPSTRANYLGFRVARDGR